ncbi:MAG: DUF2252 family protein [Phreatobacter sp.]
MTSPDRRAATLAEIRNRKMARSPHAYVRGNTLKFYEWLDASPGRVPDGPAVWICGDCHLGNLGPLADAKGKVAVQIRDLDQAVMGNPALDLIRLGLSLACAARGSDLPGVTTARMLEHLVTGYEEALAGDFESERDKSHRSHRIQKILAQSVHRRWRQLAKERLEDTKSSLPRGKRFWSLTAEERSGLGELFGEERTRAMVTGLKSRDSDAPIELVDAAYWVKGCSSLGRLRYAVLLRVGDDPRLCLVDVKEATTAAAPRLAGVSMPRDNAARVVQGANVLSPNLGHRMVAARLAGTGVVLRELMPQDLKIEVEQLTPKEAMRIAGYLAGVVGRAHGAQMDAATRRSWRAELARARLGALDAPSWLWSSVVALVADHEAAYLEHCRRFALWDAARAKPRAA